MVLPRGRPRPAAPADAKATRARAIQRWDAGRYVGCPACGRLLRIEWAVRSLVCSCGSRIPVGTDRETEA